jgi:hypothetical protein
MKKYTDKELADYLLEMRQHNGRTPLWRKKYRWRLVVFWLIIALFLVLGISSQSWGFFGFVLGFGVGIVFRDRAYRRQLDSIWPFYGKVIDWLKLEKIANGEPSA